jgi:ATP-binding cassette, subfamily B, multidrug efflux pump
LRTKVLPVKDTGPRVSDRDLYWLLGQFLAPYLRQIGVVFLLLGVVTVLSLLLPYLVQRVVDGPITRGDANGLIPYGIAYFVTILGLFAARIAHTYLLQTVGQNALVDLRQRLFEHILRQDMSFFNKTPVGQLVSRLSNDIEALTEMVSTSIVVVVSNMITLIGIIGVMFAINWRMALISLAVLPVMAVATNWARGKIRHASSLYHQVIAEYLAYINEQFGGMLLVQLFNNETNSRRRFNDINQQIRDVHSEMRDQYTLYASILQILAVVGLGLVLYGGGRGVLGGWVTLGTLIAFIEYSRRSFEPIMLLSEQFAQIQTALSAGERIARMLREQPSITEPRSTRPIKIFNGTLTFEHVSFSYTPGTPVLRDVDFHIQPGQMIAVVGATGAGKTSLAGLAARFYDVNDGRILIDGIDIRHLSLNDLRHYITVVPQNPYCFHGNIADNLCLFENNISRHKMIEAAQIAHAAPFIERLPGQYDYPLMPGGANLSQGQRQLLALTRALLHNPRSILILDEATSSIDTETEALIQAGLSRVLHGRTSLVIAHRLSTIREADRIFVMHKGQIIEEGNHDTLLERGGAYANLYHEQFSHTA